jgi:hypothetical protein
MCIKAHYVIIYKSYFHSEVSKACDSLRDKEFLIPKCWEEELGEVLVSPKLATLQWVTNTLSFDQVLALLMWNCVTIDDRFKSTYSFSTFRTVHMNYSLNYFSESKCAIDRILVSTLLIANVGYGVMEPQDAKDLEGAPARRAHKVFPQDILYKKNSCVFRSKRKGQILLLVR